MTVSSETSRKTFAGNGVTTSFGTSPMVFFDSADLTVYVVTTATGAVVATLVENTDYTVTGGAGTTGTVSLAGGSDPYGAPPTGTTLVIVRDVAATQESDFVNNDPSDAEVVEDALDRLTMGWQQLKTRLGRALRLADSDVSGASVEIPAPEPLSLFAWNAAGTALVNYVLVAGTSLVDLATSAGASFIGFIQSGAGAILRTLQTKNREYVTLTDFAGVDPTGATDSTVGIQAAFDSGAKVVRDRDQGGTYKINLATITIPKDVSFLGAGIGKTIFDGSGATYADLTSGTAIRTAPGSWTQIAELASNVAKGDRSIPFATPHGRSVGDVICIYSPTDYSWSGFRAYYKAGEMIRVAEVTNSTTIVAETPLADSYVAASVDVYVMTNATHGRFADFTVKALSSSANVTYGFQLSDAVDSAIERVRSDGASYGPFSLYKVFNVSVNDCYGMEDFSSDHGGDYGLIISNSYHVKVKGGGFSAARHGVTMGGGSAVCDVPNRYCYVDDADISTNGDSFAADVHGNSEFCGYRGCTIVGGVVFGGDNITVTGNTIIGGESSSGSSIAASELLGCNHTVDNNIITTSLDGNSRGTAYDVGGNSNVITGNTTRGGILSFCNNKIRWSPTANLNGAGISWMAVVNRGSTATDIDIVVDGNTITSTARRAYCLAQVTSGSPFRSYSLRNNNGIKVSGGDTRGSATGPLYSALMVQDSGNNFDGGYTAAFSYNHVKDRISVHGSTYSNHRFSAAAHGVDTTYRCRNVSIVGNDLIENLVNRTGTPFTQCSAVAMFYHTTAVIDANNVSNSNEVLFVADNSSFVVGEVVTGAGGATATIADFRSTTEIAIAQTRSGTFVAGETLTGSVAGSTTLGNPTFIAYTATSAWAPSTITTMFRGDNIVTGGGSLVDVNSAMTTNRAIASSVSADNGNAAKTLTPGMEQTQMWSTALTADRAVTLSTTGAYNGQKFRIVRAATATGAFNLNVGTGPLKAMGTAGSYSDVEFNGTAWVLTGYGTL